MNGMVNGIHHQFFEINKFHLAPRTAVLSDGGCLVAPGLINLLILKLPPHDSSECGAARRIYLNAAQAAGI